jgi:hypothetical protein
MEQTIKPLPAVADPRTQDVFRRGLGHLAGQVAARQAEIKHMVEHAQTEPPPLFCTADSSEVPPAVKGTLWYIGDQNRIFYYNLTYGLWLETTATVTSGNGQQITISAGRYGVSRIALPSNSFISTVYIGVFSTTGIAGHADVLDVTSGATLGSTTFSMGAALYAEIAITINTSYLAVAGIQVELILTSGTLPATDVQFRYRRMPV